MHSAYKTGGKEILLASSFLNDHPELSIIYDVGANRGEWTYGIKNNVNRRLQFYMFDPLRYLEDHRARLCPFAKSFTIMLSDCEKEVDWYDRPSGGGYGASYYKESTPHYEGVKPIKARCKALDTLVQEHSLPTPHFLKIDTQGSELDILDGASNLVKDVNYIQLEITKSGKHLQHGAPTYEECIAYMEKLGFKIHSDNAKAKYEKPDLDVLFERVSNE